LAREDYPLLERRVMAHREQHTNREAKKPKKEKPKNPSDAQSKKWVVSEAVEVRTSQKH
jgi:hypothetical protein